MVCVVEDPNNIVGIEVTRQFNGLYHVLGGALSPLRGIGPEQLKIKSLVDRIAKGEVEEVIAATNPTVEGEATAVYLSKLLKPLGIKVTRIAMGVPVGQRHRIRRRSHDVESDGRPPRNLKQHRLNPYPPGLRGYAIVCTTRPARRAACAPALPR